MQTKIAPNFPQDLPCGGKLEYVRARDGFNRIIIYIHVKPKNTEGWIAPCANWRIAGIYANILAENGIPLQSEGSA